MRIKSTCVALALTGLLTTSEIYSSHILEGLQRTTAIRTGEYWRLFTAFWINRGGFVEISFNLLTLAAVGFLAEKIWGSKLWWLYFFTGGIVGEIYGVFWKPVGAGSSVAVCGLLGAVAAWAIFISSVRKYEIAGFVIWLVMIALTINSNIHGPPAIAAMIIVLLLKNRIHPAFQNPR